MVLTFGLALKIVCGVLLFLAALAALGILPWNIAALVLFAGCAFVFGGIIP